jgi:hypothetical protein
VPCHGRYDAARDKLESSRDSYMQHKDFHPKMAAGVDAARAAVRKQRADLAMYASVEAAKRDVTLLKGAADAVTIPRDPHAVPRTYTFWRLSIL